jgi:hypothetical protein
VKIVREIFDQLPEVDPPVGGEVEDNLLAVKEIFGAHQFHRQLPFGDAFPAKTEREFFLGVEVCSHCQVVSTGQALYPLQPLRKILVGNMARESDDRTEGAAAISFDDDPVPLGEGDASGGKVVMATGGTKFDFDQAGRRRRRLFLLGKKEGASGAVVFFSLSVFSSISGMLSYLSGNRAIRRKERTSFQCWLWVAVKRINRTSKTNWPLTLRSR